MLLLSFIIIIFSSLLSTACTRLIKNNVQST